MQPTVPFMNPDAWVGQGLSLQMHTGNNRMSTEPLIQRPDANDVQPINSKKRKHNEMSGAAMQDSHKAPDLPEIERQLDFMRHSAKGNSKYELLNIEDDGRIVKVDISLFANEKVFLTNPSTKAVTIINKLGKK